MRNYDFSLTKVVRAAKLVFFWAPLLFLPRNRKMTVDSNQELLRYQRQKVGDRNLKYISSLGQDFSQSKNNASML